MVIQFCFANKKENMNKMQIELNLKTRTKQTIEMSNVECSNANMYNFNEKRKSSENYPIGKRLNQYRFKSCEVEKLKG
ncbi:hypothetical protein T10_10175 [Trichinella papuae]|uniref:Uncharacterized protein n=1 Tax=Trichinella papuae TaxID=268474 RepID=A0A0V1N3R7_9BILA|nr:hypothetical protein T10_10175 [Trichinella papuae]